jgi:hypothetical protein
LTLFTPKKVAAYAVDSKAVFILRDDNKIATVFGFIDEEWKVDDRHLHYR